MTKDNFLPGAEYLKCAPSKSYTDGSCFTIESLKKIAESYNKYIGKDSNKQINISDNKADLVKQLTDRITTCKNNQLCWLDLPWVKQIKDNEIHKHTFRPTGPQQRFKWLSTTNINEIVKQYEAKYKDFKFLGAVPYDFEELPQLGIADLDFDELISRGIHKIGLVINLDEHYKSGSHWVALYSNLLHNQVYFFDSYGYKPRKLIAEFAKKISLWCYKRNVLNVQKGGINDDLDTESKFMRAKKNEYETELDVVYNKTRHQFKNSECGVYSVNFILRLLKGETFEEICSNVTLDDQVNECRKVYFRFH